MTRTKELILQIHLNLNSQTTHSISDSSSHLTNTTHTLHPEWSKSFSSQPISICPFYSTLNQLLHSFNLFISTSNGQLILLRSISHQYPTLDTPHSIEFKRFLFKQPNPSISTSRPNKQSHQNLSQVTDLKPTRIYSHSSASTSTSSIRSLDHHSIGNIKASPTVSISIPQNLDSAHLNDQFTIPHSHSPRTPHQQPYSHHHPRGSQSSYPPKSVNSLSNGLHSPKKPPSPSSSHPQSPTSSTYSHRRRTPAQNSVSHTFESLWQGSNQQVLKSPTCCTTIDQSQLEPSTSSSLSDQLHRDDQLQLLPSPELHSSPFPSSDLSFCSSTLITPLGYADPIVSIKIFNTCEDQHTCIYSLNKSTHLESSEAPKHSDHHIPDAQDASNPIIYTLTKFGKCSKVSPIDGHIIDTLDLSGSDGLIMLDDWSFLTNPQIGMKKKNNSESEHNDKALQTEENPLILCVSSTVPPILVNSLDFAIIPTSYSDIEKASSFYKTKVRKQSKISNNHWSINLISLTWSKELCTRELKVFRDESTSTWRIEESLDSILLKIFGDELDLEDQVEIMIDQDRFAVWSTSRFWILEWTSTTRERNLDRRNHFSKTDNTKQITHLNDSIVSLSFLDSFGVVVVLKKQVKLFRSVGLESSLIGWSEWKLAPIDEARFTLEDPFQFEFAIKNSSLPSTIDSQAALINSINLLIIDINPSTGQRRLSELSFTTEPPSHSAAIQVSDPDPDATVTLFSTNLQVYHNRRDLHISSPIIQPNNPSSMYLTCSIWLPDDYHPAILIGDSIGQVSIYSLNIRSHNSSPTEGRWKLERLNKEEQIGGSICALYADRQWIIAGGVSGDIGVWSRNMSHSLSTTDQSNERPYEMNMVNRLLLGAVPVEGFGRLPDLDGHGADGQEINDTVSRFVCLMMDGTTIVFNLGRIGLIDVEGELLPADSTIGISELWSNGPEIIVFYREKHLCAQRWLSSKNLLAKLGRQEARAMIELENSQVGLKWIQIELSNCQAQPRGAQFSTSRIFNVSGLPAFNILSVKLRDFVESIGLQEGPALAGRLSMVRLMISQLFPWGLDFALDASLEQGLGVERPSVEEHIINFNVINGDHDERSGMTLYGNNGDPRLSSDYEKTYRLLNLVVLLRVFLNEACYERHASETIVGLARLANCHTNNPSQKCIVWLDLKILIKYWLDPSAEVREAARLLAGIRLGSMTQSEIEDLVSSWEIFLPFEEIPIVKTEHDWAFSRKTGSAIQQDLHKVNEIDLRQKYMKEEMQINAMLLIGLMVSERYKLLSSKVLKNLSIAVFQAISPSHKPVNQSKIQILKAGLEICSKTFEIIQNYIDAIELVRNLFGWATGKDGEISGELKGMAKYACLHVASVNTPLFMTTLSYDLMISHNPNDRISTMKLVVFMVRKRPLVLHASLPRLLEAVVKSLDPTQKQMRAQTQTGATVILHELVKTYPSIAFHGPSQKLAIGTPEGAIIIYDLKTSTKINILESFRKPVTACSFSEDGQRLVSVSLDENRIEIWKFNYTPFALSSFFKFSSNHSSPSAAPLSNSNVISPLEAHNQSVPNSSIHNSISKPFKSLCFNVGEEAMMSIAGTLEWIRFDWLSNRSCRLRIRQSSITFSC